MAFLDNSGDIILDAVLTDTGRKRLAQGDGSFRITKFALGDDEIDYTLYNNQNPSGSAYYDLEIMQTPVLEAFTNNTSNMNSKIITIARTNLLYMPILKRNDTYGIANAGTGSLGTILIAADNTTAGTLNDMLPAGSNLIKAFVNGNNGTTTSPIRVDQGIDNSSMTGRRLSSDLIETQYMIEVDNRLGAIVNAANTTSAVQEATPSFIDDDQIAAYYLSLGTDSKYIQTLDVQTRGNNTPESSIVGALGTSLGFSIKASLDLNNTGNFLFTRLGSTTSIGGVPFYYIDTNLRVSGVTTGYKIDIPVRFIKQQ
jgi:hypothetical protein